MNQHAERSAFYRTLSQAFLPPTPAVFEGFRVALADDLNEYGSLLGYAIEDAAGFLQRVVESVGSHDALLLLYSALFLQPPRIAHLNASLHLDGAILGRSADAIERAYARYGLGRADTFGDLPDHLSLQLEFLAFLYGRAAQDEAAAPDLVAEAQDFIRCHLLSWVPMLARQLRAAVIGRELHPLYVHLTGILQEALAADAGEITEALWAVIDPERAADRQAQAREMVHCRECGVPIAPAGRVRRVRKVLEREGIDASHLDLCIDCRGAPQALLAQLTAAGVVH
jgi:TorA maturation chaperone TorD